MYYFHCALESCWRTRVSFVHRSLLRHMVSDSTASPGVSHCAGVLTTQCINACPSTELATKKMVMMSRVEGSNIASRLCIQSCME